MTTTALKILAMVTMLIDHIASFIPGTPYYLHWIGRISAPIFMYCCIIGYEKTENKLKYMLRLYILNLVMGIMSGFLDIKYNFVRTILVIVIVIFIIDKFKNRDADAKKILLSFIVVQILFFMFLILTEYLMGKQFRKLVFVILPVAQAFFVSIIMLDGGLFFVIFGVIMHIFNKNKKSFSISYIAVTILCILIYNTNITRRVFDVIDRLIYGIYPILAFISEIFLGVNPAFMKTDLLYGDPQWMMIVSLPFILMYNGEKGKGLKYLFYFFYPAHIIILYFIGKILTP